MQLTVVARFHIAAVVLEEALKLVVQIDLVRVSTIAVVSNKVQPILPTPMSIASMLLKNEPRAHT